VFAHSNISNVQLQYGTSKYQLRCITLASAMKRLPSQFIAAGLTKLKQA